MMDLDFVDGKIKPMFGQFKGQYPSALVNDLIEL